VRSIIGGAQCLRGRATQCDPTTGQVDGPPLEPRDSLRWEGSRLAKWIAGAEREAVAVPRGKDSRQEIGRRYREPGRLRARGNGCLREGSDSPGEERRSPREVDGCREEADGSPEEAGHSPRAVDGCPREVSRPPHGDRVSLRHANRPPLGGNRPPRNRNRPPPDGSVPLLIGNRSPREGSASPPGRAARLSMPIVPFSVAAARKPGVAVRSARGATAAGGAAAELLGWASPLFFAAPPARWYAPRRRLGNGPARREETKTVPIGTQTGGLGRKLRGYSER
jgi:hypothetical protein